MMTLMTRDDSVATPATDENVSGIGWELRFLDPDVVDLIAEMDAILCEAIRHHGRHSLRWPPDARCWGLSGLAGRTVDESARGAHPCARSAPCNAALRPGPNPSPALSGR
jgi:hypothetical protein